MSSKNHDYYEDDSKITIVPYKGNILQIFKGNAYYLLDRHKYDINTIMMLLDLNKINKLADFYKDYPDGIEKTLFIEKMKKELPCNLNDPMDETNLVYGLYKFFCEIDFNGDGQMQWEEFTQFIIDTVEGDNDAKVDENDDDNQNKLFAEKIMIKYKRYMISNKIKDNLIHKKDIINAVFFPRIEIMVISEYSTKILKVYDPKTGRFIRNIELDDILYPKNYLDNKYKNKKNDIQKPKSTGNNNNITTNSDNNQSLSYSVLFLFQWQNLLAVCLSDKRILFFNVTGEDRFDLIHELPTPVLEKRVWYLPEHNVWFSSGSKLPGNSFYTINELDIEFEYHNQKYDVLFNENHPYRNHYCEINPHRAEILDCIEILKPMMILTACLDGKIRLINLNDKDIVKIWSNHTLGVRSLSYNPLIDNVGIILTVGFEYFINVYCTDLSIDEAYKGKLEGHYAPVISCNFLSYSYMAVSVDEEGNVRIWDTKSRLCLQLIPTPKKNWKVVNLLNINKYNKFAVYGNKMVFYDAKYKEEEDIKEKNQAKDDNYPIKVEYNTYYQSFFVTTFRDVRVYNKEGNLYKNYKKLINNEHFEGDVSIKFFLFENNYRKFYLGFSNGAIMQFNAGNGSLIKPINEEEIEKDGIQTYKYDHTKEITSMFYYYDYKQNEEENNFILLSTSYDSLINIYNEEDPEETEKLRTLRGGHTIEDKVNEINCMDFSMRLNLFATGSTDGLIVIWDFELSKVDDICYIPNGKIDKIHCNCVKFLDPFAILIAGYNDGTFYFWGVKQNIKYRGDCILRGRNYYKIGRKIELSGIKKINFVIKEIPEVPYNVPLKKFFDSNSPFMNYVDEEKNNLFIDANDEEKNDDEENDNNNNENDEEEFYDENNLDIVPKQYKNEVIDNELNPDIYKSNEETSKIQQRYYLILGDSKGNIKILDLNGFIKKYNFEPASQVIIKSAFNVLKKDDINVETIVNHNIQNLNYKNFPSFTNFYQNIIKSEFRAHFDEITDILLIEEPFCFVTSSKDKFVKIWNFSCENIGCINVLPKLSKINFDYPKWNFVVNEKKILEKEITELVEIFEEVGLEKIGVGTKEDKAVNNMVFLDDKNEEVKVEKKEKIAPNKKRFKKIEKVFNKNVKKDDNKINISYEGFFVMDAQKKIENIINEEVPKQGINAINLKIINNVVNKQEENLKKDFEERKKEKKESVKENSMKFNNNNNIKLNVPKKKFLSPIKDNLYLKTDINVKRKSNHSNLSNNNNNDLFKNNENNKLKIINNYKKIFNNTLYSQKLFKQTFHTESNFDNSNRQIKKLKLPFLKNKNIIFKKGETEKLLNFEFYNTSYKSCFEFNGINGKFIGNNSIGNKSIQKNFKNNWNTVKTYGKDLGNTKKFFSDEDEDNKNNNNNIFNNKINKYKII